MRTSGVELNRSAETVNFRSSAEVITEAESGRRYQGALLPLSHVSHELP